MTGQKPKPATALLFVTGAVFLFSLGRTRADELKSGPQVGSTLPGRFEPFIVNGPDAGDECCLFCKYGNARVVMIFARQPSVELAELIRAVEKATSRAAKADDVGACVVVTDASSEARRRLGKLADEANLKHVVLATIDPGKVKDYDLHPDAGITVLLYDKKVVRSNHTFRPGTLTAEALTVVETDVRSHLGTK